MKYYFKNKLRKLKKKTNVTFLKIAIHCLRKELIIMKSSAKQAISFNWVNLANFWMDSLI